MPSAINEQEQTTPEGPADAVSMKWAAFLPASTRPYLSLSRFDRPVGFWLLALPCWMGLAFARLPGALHAVDLAWALLFGVGAVAMRGAGCTWNDITDKDLDAQVTRTKTRPLPAGDVSLSQAYAWLGIQLAIGFLVFLCLPVLAKLMALLAIPLVVAYPFMKRVTWWPQAWLGITFNWGVVVGAATAGNLSLATWVLLVGLACWTVAYDTIYALQDREDDALVGIRSTARLFGARAGLASFCFHLTAGAWIALATSMAGGGRMAALIAIAYIAHGYWQYRRLRSDEAGQALGVFKSNVWAGALILAGFVLAGLF